MRNGKQQQSGTVYTDIFQISGSAWISAIRTSTIPKMWWCCGSLCNDDLGEISLLLQPTAVDNTYQVHTWPEISSCASQDIPYDRANGPWHAIWTPTSRIARNPSCSSRNSACHRKVLKSESVDVLGLLAQVNKGVQHACWLLLK